MYVGPCVYIVSAYRRACVWERSLHPPLTTSRRLRWHVMNTLPARNKHAQERFLKLCESRVYKKEDSPSSERNASLHNSGVRAYRQFTLAAAWASRARL
jgi:hypothetical protein